MDSSFGELFDGAADYDQWDRSRPHRHQPAVICFLTMRLDDSLPVSVLQRWHREKVDFLRRRGISVKRDWKDSVAELSVAEKLCFDKQFARQRETTLDSCLGRCQLAVPWAARIVSESLAKFHGSRYWLGDLVVMPNHVHCLVAFKTPEIGKAQPGGWMRYSARLINGKNGRTGKLWFPEPFDHLVRSEEQLNYLRSYIRKNPAKAGLRPGCYLYQASGGKF